MNGLKPRNGKFISVANMKGGVGKTTTVVSLAEALSADDQSIKVLVVDMDAQSSASICVAGDVFLAHMINAKQTLDHLLSQMFLGRKEGIIGGFVRDGISQVTHGGDQLNVSLIPSSPLLRSFERDLIYSLTRRRLTMEEIDSFIWKSFDQNFSELKKTFDFVIFDCAPGISPITEVAIRSSDLVIVPTIPDFLSVYGLKVFCQSIWETEREGLPLPKRPPHVLITKYQAAMKQHKDTCIDLYNRATGKDPYFSLFNTVITQSSFMANAMADTGIPTFSRKYSSAGAKLLDPLVREIRGIV